MTRNLSGAQGTELEARIEQNNLNNINQLLNQSSMHNDRVENSQICRNIQKAITKKIERNILELLNIPAKTEKRPILLPFFSIMVSRKIKKTKEHISRFSPCSKMAGMSNSRPWGNAFCTCQNPYPEEGPLSQFVVGTRTPPWGLTLISALK